jgi:hypothetical protein
VTPIQGCSLQSHFHPTNNFDCPLPANSSQCGYGAPTCPGPPTPGTTCTGGAYSAALPLAECSAWQELFDAWQGTQWNYCNASRLDPCTCQHSSKYDPGGYDYGVACYGGHVTALDLAMANLQGTIPAVIKRFTELTHLDLSSNKLTGLVPELLWSQYTGKPQPTSPQPTPITYKRINAALPALVHCNLLLVTTRHCCHTYLTDH